MNKTNKFSVYLVDDERIIREGMKQLINWEEYGFYICGDASDGRIALPEIKKLSADVIITDIKMPHMDGFELSKEIKKSSPMTEILILTGFDELEYVKKSLQCGIFDYLLKPVTREQLRETLSKLYLKLMQIKPSYPFEEENDIIKGIKQTDTNLIFKKIDFLFQSFSNEHTSIKNSALICKKIIETIRLSILELNTLLIPDLSSPFLTMEELRSTFTEYCINACKYNDISFQTPIMQIKHYIDDNFFDSEVVSLNFVAKKYFFNKSYLSRLFKAETGQNYNDYVLEVRIRHAKEMLKNSNISIQQICDNCGFGNSKYFSSVFKEIVGISPTQYRLNNSELKDDKKGLSVK